MKRIWKSVAVMALLATLLTGCFMRSPDELYALPKQAEDYYNLQQAIDAVMAKASYCAPLNGENRQAVQLKDLDGDGTNEAVVFAKAEGEHPLKIYVFGREGNVFSQIACMEGDGVNFDAVYFAQIDGRDSLEIVVGRQLSEGVPQSLSIYAMQDGSMTEQLNASYNQFVVGDLDQDGMDDVFLLRSDVAFRDDVALLYRWQDGRMQSDPEVYVSASTEAVRRVVLGKIEDEVPAVFVAGNTDENNLTTDVFAVRDGEITNLTRLPETGTVNASAQCGTILFADIDADGVTELPQVLTLPSAGESGAEQGCQLVRWYSLSLSGAENTKMLAAQRMSGSWYVELQQQWQADLRILCQTLDDGQETIFYQRNPATEALEEIFTIYELTGDDRESAAEQDGRFLLDCDSDTAFAASIGTASYARGLTREQLSARFHLISNPVVSGS